MELEQTFIKLSWTKNLLHETVFNWIRSIPLVFQCKLILYKVLNRSIYILFGTLGKLHNCQPFCMLNTEVWQGTGWQKQQSCLSKNEGIFFPLCSIIQYSNSISLSYIPFIISLQMSWKFMPNMAYKGYQVVYIQQICTA